MTDITSTTTAATSTLDDPAAPAAFDDAQERLKAAAAATLPIGTVEHILNAPSDIKEEVIEVPEWGCSIKIRSLTAGQSAKVRQAGVDLSTGKPVMNWEALEKAQFEYGVAEPKFEAVEVTTLHHRSGPGFQRVIQALDRISGTNPKAVKETLESFQASGAEGQSAE